MWVSNHFKRNILILNGSGKFGITPTGEMILAHDMLSKAHPGLNLQHL